MRNSNRLCFTVREKTNDRDNFNRSGPVAAGGSFPKMGLQPWMGILSEWRVGVGIGDPCRTYVARSVLMSSFAFIVSIRILSACAGFVGCLVLWNSLSPRLHLERSRQDG